MLSFKVQAPQWISVFVAIFSNLPSAFNSFSYSKSGRHLTSFTLPMQLFSPVSLPVTYSVAFSRSMEVSACPFMGRSRSSATYMEILHFPLHELTSAPALPVHSKTEEAEVSPLLAYKPLLSLPFFFFFFPFVFTKDSQWSLLLASPWASA